MLAADVPNNVCTCLSFSPNLDNLIYLRQPPYLLPATSAKSELFSHTLGALKIMLQVNACRPKSDQRSGRRNY